MLSILLSLISCLPLSGVTGPHGQDSRDCGGGHATKSVMNSLFWLVSTLVQHVVCFPLDIFSLVNLTCLVSDFHLSEKDACSNSFLHLQGLTSIFKLDLKILCYMVESKQEKVVDSFLTNNRIREEGFLKDCKSHVIHPGPRQD